jgi:hypothetical protein
MIGVTHHLNQYRNLHNLGTSCYIENSKRTFPIMGSIVTGPIQQVARRPF